MAFNPFSWFRQHQKGAIVALTILTMIIFIGQAGIGKGDPIDQLMNLVGAGRASGEVVTTLYGKKVHTGDLTQLGQKRRLANDFVAFTVNTGHQKALTELNKSLKEVGEASNLSVVKKIIADYQQTQAILGQLARMGNSPMLGQFLAGQLQQVDGNLRLLESVLLRKDLKEDEKNIINRVVNLLGFQRGVLGRLLGVSPDGTPIARDSFYFGGTIKTEDLLDFRLWQIQADRLGIKLTDEDVIRELITESAGTEVLDPEKPFGEQKQAVEYLRSLRQGERGGVAPSELLNAVREELRVVIAQSILLGSEPGMRAYRSILGASNTPSLATPDEFLHFVREQRTTMRVQFFPIEASSFLPKVTDHPSETEIQARYERGSKLEPNPEMREPGFKRPRRIEVQYVLASPDDPHYVEQARKDVQILRKLADPTQRLRSIVASITAPGLAKVVPIALDPLYSDIEPELRNNDLEWFHYPLNLAVPEEDKRKKLHLTSVYDPAVIASAVAGLHGGPMQGLVSLFSQATRQELRQSIPLNLTMLLSQADPGQLFGAAALAAYKLPPMVPQSLIEPQVLAAREKTLAAEAVQGNLRTMRDELAKLSKKPKEAQAYIAKAVKDYHLSLYSMPEANSFFGILDDLKAGKKLNLEPLRKVLDGEKPERLPNFVASLFGQGPGVYVPEQPRSSPDAKQEVLFWRSIDKGAENRSLSQVHDEVVATWRLDQARTLARDKAEHLEAEANNLNTTPAEVVRFLKDQGLTTSFEMANIAQLLPPAKEVLANRSPDYQPFQVPQELADQMSYPPQDLAKQLMRLKRPGQTAVIVDRPAKTFFLAVLLDRNEPTLEEFKRIYTQTQSDSLYVRFLAQRRADYRKSVIEQLRREAAGELDKEGRFKLPDSVRKEDTANSDAE